MNFMKDEIVQERGFSQAAEYAQRAKSSPAPLKGVQLIRETLGTLEWCFKSLIPAPAKVSLLEGVGKGRDWHKFVRLALLRPVLLQAQQKECQRRCLPAWLRYNCQRLLGTHFVPCMGLKDCGALS